MKKMILAVILLLLVFIFPSIPKVSADTSEDLRRVTSALPDVPSEPMSENSTTEDYLNTTNPYSQINPLGEETEEEGANPLYVLVFADEEERGRTVPFEHFDFYWDVYAEFQIERGDEALVANFGIDIRIMGFEEWDSDDSIEYMTDPDEWDLCDELLADEGHYLRTWYDGQLWYDSQLPSNYVDAIIGITNQATPQTPNIAGVAPSENELNQGAIFFLLNWNEVYWKDDNLVQHEASHLYDAPDHPGPQPPAPCCAMAYHTHFHWLIWEDYWWWVGGDVMCAYTIYEWCTDCHQVIQQNSGRYPIRTLSISTTSGGNTDPEPGIYTYSYDSTASITASPDSGYTFDHWVLDGTTVYGNPYDVTMTTDHTLKACFSYINNPPNTPSKPSGCTSGYVNWPYTYSTSPATDPDGDDIVQYEWFWGGITTTLTTTPSASHSWSSPGTYGVCVRAKDEYGLWSDWSDFLEVTMSYSGGGGGGSDPHDIPS